ncbi:MAG: hypothetical protein QXS32_07670 [Candidatus Nezhaarchaeales archaeon]
MVRKRRKVSKLVKDEKLQSIVEQMRPYIEVAIGKEVYRLYIAKEEQFYKVRCPICGRFVRDYGKEELAETIEKHLREIDGIEGAKWVAVLKAGKAIGEREGGCKGIAIISSGYDWEASGSFTLVEKRKSE